MGRKKQYEQISLPLCIVGVASTKIQNIAKHLGCAAAALHHLPDVAHLPSPSFQSRAWSCRDVGPRPCAGHVLHHQLYVLFCQVLIFHCCTRIYGGVFLLFI